MSWLERCPDLWVRKYTNFKIICNIVHVHIIIVQTQTVASHSFIWGGGGGGGGEGGRKGGYHSQPEFPPLDIWDIVQKKNISGGARQAAK